MNDPFQEAQAANPEDQHYLQRAYDKWTRRKHRNRVEVVVFIHKDGGRRYRILDDGAFRLSMTRIGERPHKLANFFPSGVIHIERDFRAA